VLLLSACTRTPDDVAIHQALTDMTKAVEARDNQAFLTHVSEQYRDHEGRDRRALRQLLLANFMQHPNILVLTSDTTLRLDGERAEMQLQARLTSGEQLLADRRFGAYRVRLLWQREGRTWRIFQAEWRPMSDLPDSTKSPDGS